MNKEYMVGTWNLPEFWEALAADELVHENFFDVDICPEVTCHSVWY